MIDNLDRLKRGARQHRGSSKGPPAETTASQMLGQIAAIKWTKEGGLLVQVRPLKRSGFGRKDWKIANGQWIMYGRSQAEFMMHPPELNTTVELIFSNNAQQLWYARPVWIPKEATKDKAVLLTKGYGGLVPAKNSIF